MGKLLLLPLVLALLAPVPLGAQERRLDPLDEAAQDASWTAFRDTLLSTLQKRDRAFVVSILDPDVRSSLEGERGVEAFRAHWHLDSDSSPLWRELATVLALPAAYHRPGSGPVELCVPYVAVRWPQDMDAYTGGAIVAGKAPVKAAPASASATIATLSYNMVEVADWEVADRAADSKQKWVKIKLKEGEGYVPEEQIRSPIEHAACFVKGEGGWRLVGFGPGGGK
ncbi:MAG: hypothetical protein HYY78_14725 [Betaproteobacteria bacterium]|nr:hypothetical protein [Betaproteobacteria bacterium]